MFVQSNVCIYVCMHVYMNVYILVCVQADMLSVNFKYVSLHVLVRMVLLYTTVLLQVYLLILYSGILWTKKSKTTLLRCSVNDFDVHLFTRI